MINISGKEALVRILDREGVEYVFGIPGATEAHFIDILEEHPEIKYILCLHELTAAGMAEGYARASGKTAFLNLHTNTGLAAALPLLSNAFYGHVPMVVTAGQQDTRLLVSEPAMSDNLVKIAAPFTKWGAEVTHVEDLPVIMRRAFRLAAHPPTGPVFVSLPLDVMTSNLVFEYDPGDVRRNRTRPDPQSVTAAVDLLLAARNPVMLVEDGITRSGSLNEAVRLAELAGVKVYQVWMADVNFPVSHPQYLGDLDITSSLSRCLLEEVDVLLVAGARLFQQPVYLDRPLLSAKTQIIQIDDIAREMGKNYSPACRIEGDIQSSLEDLACALETKISPQYRESVRQRVALITAEKQLQAAALESRMLEEKDKFPVSGTRLMQEIRDAVRPGTLIIDDCWSYSAQLRSILPLDEAGCYQRTRGGSIGGGLPAALGARLASADRPVVCSSGDGSAMWGIQSLWVAARYSIPVTFIIVSNAAYRQVRIMKTKILGEQSKGRNLGTELGPPVNDFCRIAEGMGLLAEKVERPGQLRAALNRSLTCGKPYLVDVSVDAAF